MTDKEFKNLPTPVQEAIKKMGLDVSKLSSVVNEESGIGVLAMEPMNDEEVGKAFENLLGITDTDNPVKSFMDFLDDMFGADEDNDETESDDNEPCPLDRFMNYMDKYDDRMQILMNAIQKNPGAADEVFMNMFDVEKDCVVLAKRFIENTARPANKNDESEYIVPISGLVKVYAENEEDAIARVKSIIESEDGYRMPIDVNGIADAEEVYGATCAYEMGDIVDGEIDDVINEASDAHDDNVRSCPLANLCQNE